MSERSPAADEVVQVAESVDEYVERTRHTQILDAKDLAAEALRDAGVRRMKARKQGLSSREANAAACPPVRSAVESYILECESLYRRTEEGEALWTEADLGTIDVADWVDVDLDNVEEVSEITVDGSAIDRLSVIGIEQFLELSGVKARIHYQHTLPRRGKATEERTITREVMVPIEVSRNAYRATNTLLTALDIGVKTGEEETTIESDYSELLEGLDDDVNGD